MTGLAAFIRKIHDSNICLPDLYAWHIFISENGEEYEYAVIDLHRMSRNVTSRRQKIKNLGRLHHSMLDKYFDKELKQRFFESYCADGQYGDVTELAARVEKYSETISARRRQVQY